MSPMTPDETLITADDLASWLAGEEGTPALLDVRWRLGGQP